MSAATQLTTARDFYLVRANPYGGSDRDIALIKEIRAIETSETEGWVRSRTPSPGDGKAAS
jgi:hypothetical protein